MALAPLLINISLYFYIFFFFRHNKLTRLFYSLLIPLCMWQFIDFIARISADRETATYWYYVLSPALNTIPSLGLHFTLAFTQKKQWLKKRWLIFVIYFPAFAFILLSYGGFIRFTTMPSFFWRWVAIGGDNAFAFTNATWIVLSALIILSLLLHFVVKTRCNSNNLHMQARLVCIGFTLPTLTCIVTEFIFPFILRIEPIPLLSTTLAIFSVCVFIALTRYQLLSYKPRHAWPSIIRNMKDGLLIVNNDGIIQFANEAFCGMTGYPVHELLDKKAGSMRALQTSEAGVAYGVQVTSERYELPLQKKDGTLLWCRVNDTPYFGRSGHVIGSIIIHSDITDMKKTELALLESESGLRTFIGESLLSIHLLDPVTGKVVYANRAFYNMMQYSEQEIKELYVYDFINHPKEDVDERIRQIISLRRINAGEREWRRRDGKIVNVLVSSVCFQRQGKDIIYIVAQDITAAKELERSLMEKIRDLNIFIYQVSHDIKGPLTSIIGLTNLALKESNSPEHRNYFSMIAQSTKRLDNTLNALLDIIVITQGKLKYQPVDLGREVDEIKKNLAYLPNYQKVRFNEAISITQELVADRAMLITIMQNLLSNAINYADLRHESPVVNFQAVQEDGMVKIVVEDNGVGIAPALHGKIWDMFFRASESSKGSGLGLFIVRNAVERLNGEIYLHSEPGRGSRFIVTIPAFPQYPYAN